MISLKDTCISVIPMMHSEATIEKKAIWAGKPQALCSWPKPVKVFSLSVPLSREAENIAAGAMSSLRFLS
jgi:hypothetical protein